MAGNAQEVKLCYLDNCPFWFYRFGKKEKTDKKILSVLKSIREFCLDCSVYNKAEIKNCDIPECPLYKFRMGHNPARKGIGGNVNAFK